MQFAYRIIQSTGGLVPTPTGNINIAQMLESAGERGGELSAVVPVGPGVLEWIFKFAGPPPTTMFS
jgi:hypothetical protein